MELNEKIILLHTVLSQKVGDEMVLLDMESEHYFGVKGVGGDILNLLKEKKTLQEILSILFTMYDVDSAVLKKDLLTFVDKLRESGLVKIG